MKRKGTCKGVTDKISKKWLGALSVLSNCMKRWLFCIFSNTKNKLGNAGANAQEQQGGFCLFYAGTTLALLRFWWLLSLASSMASSDQKARA